MSDGFGPWPALSVFEAGGAHFGEQRFGCNAQFFGRSSFIPATFAESVFEQDAFDVQLCAISDVVEAAFPGK